MPDFWKHRQNLWTTSEEELLRQLVAEGQTRAVIAVRLGYSSDAVRVKMGRLGLRLTPPSPWDDRAIDILRRSHARGLSFSTIADEIGGGVTRNACIGKAQRIGLPMREPSKAPKLRLKSRPERKTKFHAKSPMPKAPQLAPEPFRRVIPADIPAPLNKSILDLAMTECRWPVTDDPPHLFCGHPVVDGCSYCAAHYRIGHSFRRAA